MYVRTAQFATGRRRRTLGDPASLWDGLTRSLNPFVFLPADWNYLTSPGQPDASQLTIASDWWSNAAYGALTQAQADRLKQEAAQAITQASAGNTALAARQIALANQNIDASVNMNGGVAPGVGDLFSTVSSPGPLGVPLWIWGVGAVGTFLFFKR